MFFPSAQSCAGGRTCESCDRLKINGKWELWLTSKHFIKEFGYMIFHIFINFREIFSSVTVARVVNFHFSPIFPQLFCALVTVVVRRWSCSQTTDTDSINNSLSSRDLWRKIIKFFFTSCSQKTSKFSLDSTTQNTINIINMLFDDQAPVGGGSVVRGRLEWKQITWVCRHCGDAT